MNKTFLLIGLLVSVIVLSACVQPPKEVKDCGTLDLPTGRTVSELDEFYSQNEAALCFQTAFSKCSKAKLISKMLTPEGQAQTYLEIKGKTDVPNICKVYYRLDSYPLLTEIEGKSMECFFDYRKNFWTEAVAGFSWIYNCVGELKDFQTPGVPEPVGITCQSSSSQVISKEWSITSDDTNFALQNATGTTIPINEAVGSNGFTVSGWSIPSESKSPGEIFLISNAKGITGILTNAKVAITYETEAGLLAVVEVTCSGNVW